MTFFDFLATRNAGDIIRLLEGLVNIVAAILTGVALRNVAQIKRMIGGIVQPGRLKRLVRRIRRLPEPVVDAEQAARDAYQSLTLAEKVDMLKDNQEVISLRVGIDSDDIHRRLDRVDPPNRRH